MRGTRPGSGVVVASLVALVAGALPLLVAVVGSTAGAHPAGGTISSDGGHPTTIYTVTVSGHDNADLFYNWQMPGVSCGSIQRGQPAPNQLTWTHPHEQDTSCQHVHPDHPDDYVTVSIYENDAVDLVATCRYDGVAAGSVACEPSDSPSPAPSPSGSVFCERYRTGEHERDLWRLRVVGTDGADTIEVRPRAGSDLEVEVVANGQIICTHFLSDFDHVLIQAGGGDDTVSVSGEINKDASIYGDAGNDTLRGGSGTNRLYGGPGKDTITGGPQGDSIFDIDGDTAVDGRGGGDDIKLGPGNDDVRGGGGPDTIKPGGGANKVDGGDGDDSVIDDLDEVLRLCRMFRVTCDLSKDVFDGGAGDDRLVGGGGVDVLTGGVGNDDVKGGKHDDVLKGEGGRDELEGGSGSDRLSGGGGNDRLTGGSGSGDTCDGGPGKDRIFIGGQTGCETSS